MRGGQQTGQATSSLTSVISSRFVSNFSLLESVLGNVVTVAEIHCALQRTSVWHFLTLVPGETLL
jgi:hypothetical protein